VDKRCHLIVWSSFVLGVLKSAAVPPLPRWERTAYRALRAESLWAKATIGTPPHHGEPLLWQQGTNRAHPSRNRGVPTCGPCRLTSAGSYEPRCYEGRPTAEVVQQSQGDGGRLQEETGQGRAQNRRRRSVPTLNPNVPLPARQARRFSERSERRDRIGREAGMGDARECAVGLRCLRRDGTLRPTPAHAR
jgi:hypothetical protein